MFEAKKKENRIIRPDKTVRTIRAGVTWRLQLTDQSAAPFLRWMYYPGNPLAMPRKAALTRKALDILCGK
jgi:hypothetical protein